MQRFCFGNLKGFGDCKRIWTARQNTKTDMTTLTRKEYERMSLEGLALPANFTLVEEDGCKKDVFLTFGAAAAVENARMKNPDVRWAVTCVADLVDFYHVGCDEMPTRTDFSNFLESGDAYKAEHAGLLEGYVNSGLFQVEAWLQNRKADDCADLVSMATRSTSVLRAAKFCGQCWACAGGV